MGKIRVKTLGAEEFEEKEKKKAQVKKEQKEARKTAKAPGLKGGERVVAVGPTEEELAALEQEKPATTENTGRKTEATEKKSVKTMVARKKRPRSKSYQTSAKLVEKGKRYSLTEALELLAKLKRAEFDETVELHINTVEPGITATFSLPHGSGKQLSVAIADPSAGSGQVALDELLKKVESGVIDFDVLIATPAAMPKLAKVAKFLGPRGLMPNPKNGTITSTPEDAAKKFAAGQITLRTEAKAPVMHMAVGKMSFGDKKLQDNIEAVFAAVRTERIRNVILKSTMGPGIKIQI